MAILRGTTNTLFQIVGTCACLSNESSIFILSLSATIHATRY